MRETAPPKPKPKPEPKYTMKRRQPQKPNRENTEKNPVSNLIGGFFPPNLYNRKTKKIFGMLNTEDLLLIALILLFSEKDEDNDPSIVLALLYILLDIPQIL